MFYELFQVLLEGLTVDGLVSLTLVKGAVLLRPKEQKIMLERPWASDPWLIFDCVADFIDEELQWSEAFHRYVVSELTREGDRE